MTKKTQSPISETTIWQAILKEEPYEGDHWADENLNESSEDEVYLSDILGSDSSTSSIGGEPSSPSSTAEIPVSVPMVAPSETGERAGRAVVEKLSQKQYWGPSWTPDLSPWDKFDMARPSIIGIPFFRGVTSLLIYFCRSNNGQLNFRHPSGVPSKCKNQFIAFQSS